MQLIPYAEPGLIGLWDTYSDGRRVQIAEFRLHADGWSARVRVRDFCDRDWDEWPGRYPTPEEAANEVAEWLMEAEPIQINASGKVIDLEEYRQRRRA